MRILVSLFSLVTTASLYAGPFTTLYVEGSVGVFDFTSLEESQIINEGTNFSALLDQKSYASDTEAIVEGRIGGGVDFCRWVYVGGEVFVNYRRPSSGTDARVFETFVQGGQPGDFDVSSTTRESVCHTCWGVGLTPGVVLCPDTLVFGVFGWERSDNSADFDARIQQSNVGLNGVFGSDKIRLDGVRLGFGYRQFVCGGLALTFRSVYSRYGSWKYGGINISTTSGFEETEYRHTARPGTWSSQIGIAYHFGRCNRWSCPYDVWCRPCSVYVGAVTGICQVKADRVASEDHYEGPFGTNMLVGDLSQSPDDYDQFEPIVEGHAGIRFKWCKALGGFEAFAAYLPFGAYGRDFYRNTVLNSPVLDYVYSRKLALTFNDLNCGLRTKFGFELLCGMSLEGRVGVVYNFARLRSTLDYFHESNTPDAGAFSMLRTKHMAGLEYGVTLSKSIARCFDVTVTYSATDYPRMRDSFEVVLGQDTLRFGDVFSLSSRQALLGLNYSF